MASELNERESGRMAFRIGMFQRRGCTKAEAEQLADRMVQRDRDRDDRRMCIECRHVQRDRGCFVQRQGVPDADAPRGTPNAFMPGTPHRNFQVLMTVLQRCNHFSFQTP